MMITMELAVVEYLGNNIGGIDRCDDHDRESVKKTNLSMGGMKQGVLSGQVNRSLPIYSFRMDIVI